LVPSFFFFRTLQDLNNRLFDPPSVIQIFFQHSSLMSTTGIVPRETIDGDERPIEPEAAQQAVIARPTEPDVAQQSVIAVSDLSVFGTNFPDGYIFTRKEIEDYRREFNSKLVNNIKISNAQRTKRMPPMI